METSLDHSYKVFTTQLLNSQPPVQNDGSWTIFLQNNGVIECKQAWIQVYHIHMDACNTLYLVVHIRHVILRRVLYILFLGRCHSY